MSAAGLDLVGAPSLDAVQTFDYHALFWMAAILAVRAVGDWLDRYQLNYSPRATRIPMPNIGHQAVWLA